jgi:hypothetical protein
MAFETPSPESSRRLRPLKPDLTTFINRLIVPLLLDRFLLEREHEDASTLERSAGAVEFRRPT